MPSTMPDTWALDRTSEGVLVRGEIDLASADSFEERASEAVMEADGASVLILPVVRALPTVQTMRCSRLPKPHAATIRSGLAIKE